MMVLSILKRLWILLFILPLLTACPTPGEVSASLNVLEAAPGAVVKATLKGMSGIGATVTVAKVPAAITTTSDSSVSFVVPNLGKDKLGKQEVAIHSAGKVATASLTIVESSLKLDKERAERGETVTGTVKGISLAGARLKLAGIEVAIAITSASNFTFVIPANTPADLQIVSLEPQDGPVINQAISILGDVIKGSVTLIVKPATNESELRKQIEALGFSWEGSLQPLGASTGPCAGGLADIEVGDTPLGEALIELQELEQNGQGIVLHVDPRAGWSVGTTDHLGATGSYSAHARGRTGAGTMIAVLDTGVSDHPELGSRLRDDLGYDFVHDDALADDDFDDLTTAFPNDGHGTPIAVLAAGSLSGVAPAAEIMPIKVCNDTGLCQSSDVILGVCHALTTAPDLGKLILNLSLGGDTAVDALEAILRYALEQNVLIAAAAGNEGESGSPTHYPAAFLLDGLVATAALEAPTLSCLDFETQSFEGSHPVGSTLTDNGVTMTFKAFYEVENQPITSGAAVISDRDLTAATNKMLVTGNINTDFAFPFPLDGLTLLFEDNGSAENLELNGELRIVGSLNELDGEIISKVNIEAPIRTGQLRLTGSIEQFAIGGQEFWIDDICPVKTSAWRPAAFSTRGAYVDIAAPGVALRSGTPAGGYFDAYEGTSFATPLVAGALALWREANPAMSPADIEQGLKDSALPLSFSAEEVGAGLLDLSEQP